MTDLVTSCKDCKFAQYDGNTQIGCEFDLLDKYRNADIEVMDCYDEGEKEFNVVKRICLFSRHKSSSQTREDVLHSVKVKYQVICILPDNNYERFSFCLAMLLAQKIQPQHITIIRPASLDVKPFKYTKLLAKTNIKWRYEDCVDNDYTEGDLIDSCIDQISHPYYIVIRNNTCLPTNFSERLDDLVNNKFQKFSFIKGNNIDVVTTIFHKQLGGNSFQPLIDKIRADNMIMNTVYDMEKTEWFT